MHDISWRGFALEQLFEKKTREMIVGKCLIAFVWRKTSLDQNTKAKTQKIRQNIAG